MKIPADQQCGTRRVEQFKLCVFPLLINSTNTNTNTKLLEFSARADAVTPRQTPFLEILAFGDLDLVNLALRNGGSFDHISEYEERAIHYVASNDNEDVIQLVIDNTEDIDARTSFQETALHLAAQYSETALRLLLKNGAYINALCFY